MQQLVEANVNPANHCWEFTFKAKGKGKRGQEHLVRLGNHFTCSCRGDDKCHYQNVISDRVLNERPKGRSDYVHAENLRIKCGICHELSPFVRRGDDFCFCKQCLEPFHRECMSTNVREYGSKTCPHCRSPIAHNSDIFGLFSDIDEDVYNSYSDRRNIRQLRSVKCRKPIPEGRSAKKDKIWP